jgi:hypothetical protein
MEPTSRLVNSRRRIDEQFGPFDKSQAQFAAPDSGSPPRSQGVSD